jgi:hypothetical protein
MIKAIALLAFLAGCSSLSKLERLERPVVVIAKSNVDEDRSIVVKDKKGKLLKLTEASFVYTYNPGDTLK